MEFIFIFVLVLLVFGNEYTRRKTWSTLGKIAVFLIIASILLLGLVVGAFVPISLFLAGCIGVGYGAVKVMRRFA